jgi:hypothetical protein
LTIKSNFFHFLNNTCLTDYNLIIINGESKMNNIKPIGLSAMSLWLVVMTSFVYADEKKMVDEPITVIEEDWIIFSDQPHRSMLDARFHLLQFEEDLAANDTRRAAALLRANASHASSDSKNALLASSKELDKLADDIEEDATNTAQINKVFGKASLALAKYHTAMTYEAQTANQPQKVGHYLKATASDLEHAAAWTGHEVTKGGAMSIKVVREGAGKLIEGAGWSAEEAGKATKWLGDETKALGHKIEGNKP